MQKPRDNKSAKQGNASSLLSVNTRSSALNSGNNASTGNISTSATPSTPSPLSGNSPKVTSPQRAPTGKRAPGSGEKQHSSLQKEIEVPNVLNQIVDEAFLKEIWQLDKNVDEKLPYRPPAPAPSARAAQVTNPSDLLNKKVPAVAAIVQEPEESTPMTKALSLTKLAPKSTKYLPPTSGNPWHAELINRWTHKLGLQNVHSDLREKHLLAFFHSNFIWMKEKSYTLEQMCTALTICKTVLDKVISFPADEPIDTIFTTVLNACLEKYTRLFTPEQQQEFTQLLSETVFTSYRIYRLAFNVDIKNSKTAQRKEKNERRYQTNNIESRQGPLNEKERTESEMLGEKQV